MEALVSSLSLLRGRKVLVTGHTGFKGSWLSYWLAREGAEVHGVSLPPTSSPNLFEELGQSSLASSTICDIRDAARIRHLVAEIGPEVVFHLAAQALVKLSYDDPVTTFTTNVVGSLNILECIRRTSSVRALVYITSDKCYRNREVTRGYHESDELGGVDPYSASKACAEHVYESYVHSYFRHNSSLATASARAGNVIGGGDWSSDRLIPDCIRALCDESPITLRNPNATRPWQHVLEPLSGYVTLAGNLLSGGVASGESWNFGPPEDDVHTVEEVAERCTNIWGSGRVVVDSGNQTVHEATLLQLNCDKARSALNWRPTWSYDTTIDRTVQWYKKNHRGGSPRSLVDDDINDYVARQ